MQTHRSLKNILLPRHRFQEEEVRTEAKVTAGGSGVGVLLEKIEQQLA
jgi:hypothetical protein